MSDLAGDQPAPGGRHQSKQELKRHLYNQLLTRLNLDRLTVTGRAEAEGELRTVLFSMFEETHRGPISTAEREAIITDVLNEVFGLGPLDALLGDAEISAILVNRFDQVFVERNGKLEPSDLAFKDDRHLLRILDRIVSSVGRRIDDSSPMVSARLPDGSRLNAIIPPLAIDGPALCIRRFRAQGLRADDLITAETLTPQMLDFLRAAVTARLNIVMSGGAGAGKTTLLNVLSGFIDDQTRIITIEDAAELRLHHRHLVRLETRPPNIEGRGAISPRQLVIQALDMQPGRIVVGELRAEETLEILQAASMGHDGILTTIHASTPREALNRLQSMMAMGDLNLSATAGRQLIASAVDLLVHQAQLSDGSRRVMAISQISASDGDISVEDIFAFERIGVQAQGTVCGRFKATGLRPKCSDRLAATGLSLSNAVFDQP